jgi:hypothetical protein
VQAGREETPDRYEAFLARPTGKPGLFLILMGRAQAPVGEVTGQHPLEWKKPMPYVNHYSFHIGDPEGGTSPA